MKTKLVPEDASASGFMNFDDARVKQEIYAYYEITK